jgi:putative ABC transport system permease protein
VGDPKNRVFVSVVDDQLWKLFPDWGITNQQWDTVQHNRTGMVMSRQQAELWHKKIGDTFTIISPQIIKADGTKTWTFKILAISEDIPQAPGGINFANYDYFDKSLPLANQGRINEVDVLTDDPSHAAELAQRIDQTFANSSTPTQSQTEQSAFAVSNNFGGMDVEGVTDDIALTGLLMILFLSANVIAQSVRERFVEFATLKTFGFSDRLLVSLVILEAAIPCLAGSGLGVALAAWLAHQIPSLMPPGFGLPMPTMSATVLLWAAIGAFVMAFASATLPALRLSRMDIATALSGRT